MKNLTDVAFDTDSYLNRELSWLKFNERVLNEASDKNNSILDRFKFLTISASNLDEFDMVRLAGVRAMYLAGDETKDIAGMTYAQQYREITTALKTFNQQQYQTLNKILSDLEDSDNISFAMNINMLNNKQRDYLSQYFIKKILPFIEYNIFPAENFNFYNSVENKSLNICFNAEKENEKYYGNITIPKDMKRIVKIPTGSDIAGEMYTFVENIIEANLQTLFPDYSIEYSAPYRITRNASYIAETTDIDKLIENLEETLNERRHGTIIKLEIANNAHNSIKNHLANAFDVTDSKMMYYPSRPIDLTVWSDASKIKSLKKYKTKDYKPFISKELKSINKSYTHDQITYSNLPYSHFQKKNIFNVISEKDILLHHPYDSFQPVLDFIENAAIDPNVKSINQTLYRVSKNSPIIKSLKKAAKNGKDVTVLVELKARFNEQDNIAWARKLEEAGCKVLYGVPGLKTHSKITMVEREEDGEIKRYTHLSTGNYNDVTANIYTDLGFFTKDETIGSDAKKFFEYLQNPEIVPEYNKLFIAPRDIKPEFLSLIRNEIHNASLGKEAYIKAKMNSLCDPAIINALYLASQSGVKIDLLVRGICCLKPQVEGISDNITVHSIVGEYLEHSRIYEFCNGGDEKIFLSSADCMPRNLNRRIEILFPLEDEKSKLQAKTILECGLLDTEKSYELNSSGDYQKTNADETKFNSQEFFGSKYYRKHSAKESLEYAKNNHSEEIENNLDIGL